MRRFLLRSLFFFLLAIVVTVGVFLVVSFYSTNPTTVSGVKDAFNKAVLDGSNSTDVTGSTSMAEQVPESGLSLSTLSLSDEQKTTLNKVGIDASSFVISKPMLVCAETKLGTARLTELSNGAAPSTLEIATLTPCLVAS